MARNLSNVPVETDAPRLFSLVRGWLVRTGAWVGRQIGGHAGVFGNPTYTAAYFEVTDTENVPFMSMGLNPSEEGSEWLTIGYWDRPGIRLVNGQIVVDAATVSGAVPGSHAAVTLGAGSDAALALSGQELTLAGSGTHTHTDTPSGGLLSAYLQTANGATATLTDAAGQLWLFVSGQLVDVATLDDQFGQWPIRTWPRGYGT